MSSKIGSGERADGNAVFGMEIYAPPAPSRATADVPPDAIVVQRRLAASSPLGIVIHKVDDGYLALVDGVARCWISRDGSKIEVAPSGGPTDQAIAFCAHALAPLAVQLRGAPSFHGSGVATELGAIGFLGRSGAGKSSLAASFGSAAPLLGDDCLVVDRVGERIVAFASEGAVRLWEDSFESLAGDRARTLSLGKFEVALPRAPGPVPLVRIYLPRFGDADVIIEPLRPRDALVALASNCHRLDPTDAGLLEREVAFFEDVVAQVAVAHLTYPRDFARLSEVRAAILRDISGS